MNIFDELEKLRIRDFEDDEIHNAGEDVLYTVAREVVNPKAHNAQLDKVIEYLRGSDIE